MDYTPRMLDAALTARSAAAAGIVLLKNVRNTLPLLPEDGAPLPVAVFGIGQICTPCCTAAMQPWRSVSVLDGLCASEAVRPDGLLSHKYRTWALEHPSGTEYPLGMLSMEELAQTNRAAIIVIARAPEHTDCTLSDAETAMLRSVCAAFERTVLVLATPGFVELNDAAMACSAIVWMGIAGQEGGCALADVLTAKVMPTGHLAFSWPLRLTDFDAANRQRDQFVGYRYFDSCGAELRWPFGYGLGYGVCTLGSVSVGLDGTDITVSAEVENTGETWPAGEVVQVYVSRPDPSRTQPAWVLDCFARTKLLAPGERQTLHLRFPVTELAAYRESACAFALEEGYYDVRVGFHARGTYVVGSLRSMQRAMVQAVTPLRLEGPASRTRGPEDAFTYPGEAEELAAAHKYAIRLSPRNLPKRSRKKGSSFEGCRGDGETHTLLDVRAGRCNVFALVASMDDHSLRQLVEQLGFCPADVPGALGASAALERYRIPAMTVAAGSEGLYLTKELRNEEDEVVRRQYVTAFPSAALLACSFDPDTVRAVGRAVGREMQEYGVQLWLAPSLALLADPREAGAAERWSEDPVVTGVLASALVDGASKYGAAVLRTGDVPEGAAMEPAALRDTWLLPYKIAAPACRAALLPGGTFCGELLGENSAFVRAWIVDSGYRGMFLADGERYGAEPQRLDLERSAVRILKLLLDVTH